MENQLMYDEPAHISNKNGVSILSGRGYGAIVTRNFFENINKQTAQFSSDLLELLSDYNRLIIVMAIVSMSDINFSELQARLNIDEQTLRKGLDVLIQKNLVIEIVSKHITLGNTYEINNLYHSCICILITTLEMQRYTLQGISCCMGFGDFPIDFN